VTKLGEPTAEAHGGFHERVIGSCRGFTRSQIIGDHHSLWALLSPGPEMRAVPWYGRSLDGPTVPRRFAALPPPFAGRVFLSGGRRRELDWRRWR